MKKVSVLLCLVVSCFIYYPYAFSGQLRTYVGTNDTIKGEKGAPSDLHTIDRKEISKNNNSTTPSAQEEEEKKEYKTKTLTGSANKEEGVADIRPATVSADNNLATEIQAEAIVNNAPNRTSEKIPQSEIKIISDDHVKLNSGYHMVGEPDTK